MIKEGIQKLVDGTDLSFDESQGTLREIMAGEATNAQIAAFLTALRMKGETVEELTAFAKVMRENCVRIHPKVSGRLLDTCGTGGDKIKTFNVSTTATFVIAGAGVTIAKHGNRSVTSKSGSADVLERLGVNLTVPPEAVEKAIEQIGIGFMFAPAFHPAMKYAVATRKEVGIRTAFNILGPLTNPASANAQLLGVYDPKLTERLAYVLRGLGCEEAMVVHGLDGLDEVSTLGKTVISHLNGGEVATTETSPRDFGIKQASIETIQGATSEENAETLFKIINAISSEGDAKMDIVLVNAAAGLIIGGKAQNFAEGMELAKKSIRSGAAYTKLKALVRATCGDMSKLEGLEHKYA
jgi:anthranilate phosphoribosyltransferase